MPQWMMSRGCFIPEGIWREACAVTAVLFRHGGSYDCMCMGHTWLHVHGGTHDCMCMEARKTAWRHTWLHGGPQDYMEACMTAQRHHRLCVFAVAVFSGPIIGCLKYSLGTDTNLYSNFLYSVIFWWPAGKCCLSVYKVVSPIICLTAIVPHFHDPLLNMLSCYLKPSLVTTSLTTRDPVLFMSLPEG